MSINTHIPLRYCEGFFPIRSKSLNGREIVVQGEKILKDLILNFPGDPSTFIVDIRPEVDLEKRIRFNIEQVEKEEEAKLERIIRYSKPNEYLFEQGDKDQQIFILLDGEVDVIMDGSLIATIFEPGSFLGEMAIIRNNPRSATVRTRTECKFFCVNGGDMLTMAKDHPVILGKLCKSLANKIAKTSTELGVIKMMGNPEETRVVYEQIHEDTAFLESVQQNKNFVSCYPKNTELFCEGDSSFDIFILVSGEVKVTIGGETIARISSPGMIIGEMSSLRMEPRSATVTTLSESSFYRIHGIRLLEACKELPTFFIKLSLILANRLNETSHEYAHFLKVYED